MSDRQLSLICAAIGLGSFILLPPAIAATASDYRAQGLRDRAAGRFPAAVDALRTAVELEPDNLSGRVLLGWTLHLAGQDRAAADTLEAAIRLDPSYVPAFNALGIVYLVNADYVPAILTHLWAKALEPDNEVAHYNLSLAFERVQQYDWAIAAAQTAAALEPTNPHPLVALALAQWSRGDRAAAQQSYQQAMAIDARYRSSDFLNRLEQAGFSPEQIAQTQQILRGLL